MPVPNDKDYNLDPNTYDGEFFQEGLEGSFEIVLDVDIAMEVDNDTVIVDGNDGEEFTTRRTCYYLSNTIQAVSLVMRL